MPLTSACSRRFSTGMSRQDAAFAPALTLMSSPVQQGSTPDVAEAAHQLRIRQGSVPERLQDALFLKQATTTACRKGLKCQQVGSTQLRTQLLHVSGLRLGLQRRCILQEPLCRVLTPAPAIAITLTNALFSTTQEYNLTLTVGTARDPWLKLQTAIQSEACPLVLCIITRLPTTVLTASLHNVTC